MKWIKNIFKREKKEETAEEIETEVIEDTQGYPICKACEKPIYGEQKVKTFGGNKYHLKPCWKNLTKMAWKDFKGQN